MRIITAAHARRCNAAVILRPGVVCFTPDVACRGNHFLCDDHFVAHGAVTAFSQAGLRTRRCDRCVSHGSMSRRGINKCNVIGRCSICLPFERHGGGIRCHSVCRAGGSRYLCLNRRLICHGLRIVAYHTGECGCRRAVVVRPDPNWFTIGVFMRCAYDLLICISLAVQDHRCRISGGTVGVDHADRSTVSFSVTMALITRTDECRCGGTVIVSPNPDGFTPAVAQCWQGFRFFLIGVQRNDNGLGLIG